MKELVLVTIALEGYKFLFKECITSHKRYCKEHGYDFVLIDDLNISLKPEESSWIKLSLVKNLLKSYKYVVFLDCDCYIAPNTPPISALLENSNKSLFMAKGFSGRFNAGVIFFKSDEYTFRFLDDIKNAADFPVPDDCKAPYENGHIIHISNSYLDKIETLSTELWNNNIELSDKSYITHYSGGRLRPYYINNKVSFISRVSYGLYRRINRKVRKNADFESKKALLDFAESTLFKNIKTQ